MSKLQIIPLHGIRWLSPLGGSLADTALRDFSFLSRRRLVYHQKIRGLSAFGASIVVITVLLIGLILRLHNYAIYPQRGASSDEYSYSFLGVSLLTKHIPVSWSAFSAYNNRYDLTIKNLYFPMVYPYFDHPPLNGLLVGGWALLFGQNDFAKIELATVRLVPIFLSTVSAILVFLIGYYLWNYKTALWALLIYSTTTIFVMNGRVVFAENLLTPIALTAIYLLMIWKKSMTINKTLVLGILSGLAFLTKELGIAVFLSLLFLYVSQKVKRQHLVIFMAASLFFVLVYVLYGAYYDWDLFWKIVFQQAGRDVGPQTLLYIMGTPIIVNKIYYDGWYFFGFLAFFVSLLEYKTNQLILVPALVYLFLILFFLTQQGEMGWYLIPLFPFMAIFAARTLVKSLAEGNWFIFVFLSLVGLYEIKYLFGENFGLVPTQFRILLVLLWGPSLLAALVNHKILFKRLGNLWFYLLILGNILLTYNYIHPA